jgi:Zn finger protein HypA/HybF involved in hydrogenase expression
MGYRIPSSEILAEAIKAVLKRHPMVGSQRKLTSLVLKELKTIDEEFTAGEERIRRVAIDSEVAKIEIHCREGEEKSKYTKCPVCGSKMRRIRNETIFGGTVTLGYKCLKCPYWTGLKRRMPIRYVFYGDGYRKVTDYEKASKIDAEE